MKLLEKVRGAEHPQTATSMEQLATVLVRAGEPKAARTYAERALAIRRKLPEPDRLVIAESCRQLGGVLRDLGEAARLANSSKKHWRCTAKHSGPTSRTTSSWPPPPTWSAIWECCCNRWRTGRPLVRCWKRHWPCRKTLGDEHADTALSLVHLGNLFREMEQFGPAQSVLNRPCPC